jgi:hypothetical protein
MDATKVGPSKDCRPLIGVIFHPPYFGSHLQADGHFDLAGIEDEAKYREALKSTAELALEALEPDGLVCAIGRRYRTHGKDIQLDQWMVESFCPPLTIRDVWITEPDVNIIMARAKGGGDEQ